MAPNRSKWLRNGWRCERAHTDNRPFLAQVEGVPESAQGPHQLDDAAPTHSLGRMGPLAVKPRQVAHDWVHVEGLEPRMKFFRPTCQFERGNKES